MAPPAPPGLNSDDSCGAIPRFPSLSLSFPPPPPLPSPPPPPSSVLTAVVGYPCAVARRGEEAGGRAQATGGRAKAPGGGAEDPDGRSRMSSSIQSRRTRRTTLTST